MQVVASSNLFSLKAELLAHSPIRRLCPEIFTEKISSMTRNIYRKNFLDEKARGYSYLNASMGSSLDALNAG